MARLTLAEAAVKLGVSVRTLRRRIKAGIITPAMESGKYYIADTDLTNMAKMTGQHGMSQMTSSPGSSRVIVIDKAEYDRLIARLGFLEGQHQLLLHQKPADEFMRIELNETKSRLAEVEEELNRLKKRLDAVQGLVMRARPK